MNKKKDNISILLYIKGNLQSFEFTKKDFLNNL